VYSTHIGSLQTRMHLSLNGKRECSKTMPRSIYSTPPTLFLSGPPQND
jgi:hypothetical protein